MKSEELIKGTIEKAINSLCYTDWHNKDGGWGSYAGENSNIWATSQITWLFSQWHSEVLKNFGNYPGLPIGSQNRTQQTFQDILSKGSNYVTSQTEIGQNNDSLIVSGEPLHEVIVADVLSIINQANEIDKVASCIKFFRETQAEDGGWAINRKPDESSSIVTTSIICLVLSKVVSPTHYDLYASILADARLFLSENAITFRNGTKAWSPKGLGKQAEIRPSCYAVAALKTVWDDDELAIAGARYIMKHQHDNGSWGQQTNGNVEDTAWALIALLASGSHPKSRHITKAVNYLTNQFSAKGSFWGYSDTIQPPKIATYVTFYALNALFLEWQALQNDKSSYFVYGVKRVLNWVVFNVQNIILFLLLITGLVVIYIGITQANNAVVNGTTTIIGLLLFVIPALAIWRSNNQ